MRQISMGAKAEALRVNFVSSMHENCVTGVKTGPKRFKHVHTV